MATKRCPDCAEQIAADAVSCQYCGYSEENERKQERNLEDDAVARAVLPVGRSGWAIAAGYLGLFSFIILPAPIALIVSIIAIADLKKNPKKYGMGRAVFGLIMGILGSGILLMSIIASALR